MTPNSKMNRKSMVENDCLFFFLVCVPVCFFLRLSIVIVDCRLSRVILVEARQMSRWNCAGRKGDIYKCRTRFKGMMGRYESMVDVLRWFLEEVIVPNKGWKVRCVRGGGVYWVYMMQVWISSLCVLVLENLLFSFRCVDV